MPTQLQPNYAAPPPQSYPPAPQPVAALGDPIANKWNVTPDLLIKYQGFFAQEPKDPAGRIPGREMAKFLEQSGLERGMIVRILELSDLDRDTCFDQDEFALAMHVALCVSKRGMPLPTRLPDWLIPPSKMPMVALQRRMG
jgi:hypothetical protein